jgi:molybdopterin synthase catalytic subunit
MSRACPIRVRVQAEPFDLGAEEQALRAGRTDIGALVTFTGLVRDQGGSLRTMTLEHYPGMTQAQLEAIAAEAATRWPVLAGLVIHRFGRLAPADPIVLVAIASAHRAAAFDAASFLMDWLKTKAPFWKLEEGAQGRTWVAAKDEDVVQAERWRV